MNYTLSPEDLAKCIDQTLLQPFAAKSDFAVFCKKSADYHFKMVAVNSGAVRMCKEFLKDSDVLVGAAIGFPLGQTTIEAKVFETEDAIRNGADEIDYVINMVELKSGNLAYVESEMARVVEVCKKKNKTIKVILENCYLSNEEKKTVCGMALRYHPDFVKTSTGFGPGGALADDIRLMKSVVGDQIKIKAAGGIRSLDDALAMMEAGAVRLGTSCGVEIIDEYVTRKGLR